MINQEIADIFSKMASYIEMLDDKNAFFKARAYKRAAEVIASLPVDLADEKFRKSPQLLVAIEGIGQATSKDILEYLVEGKITAYEELKAQSPVNLEELLQVQGIGPKKILKLYKELGVTDIASLKAAADENKIAELPGFGKKSQDNILESLEFTITNKDKKPFYIVEPLVEDYLNYLSADKNIIKIDALGSFRRKKEQIGDMDFLVSSKDPKGSMEFFAKYQNVDKVLAQGDTKCSVWLKQKIQADLRVVPIDSFGAAMQYFTGSKEHNVKLRNIAIAKGYKLSEYALFNRKDDTVVESKDEEKIYELLGMQFVPPVLRENNGEVELALKKQLPHLIELSDLRGDLHTHTTWSDANNSIKEMVLAAKAKGYKYIGISDHIGAPPVANPVPESKILDYIQEIRAVDEEIDGIKVYAAAEVDIERDGSLKCDEKLLAKLDYVIASVHMSTKMTIPEMTKRLEIAIKNPLVKILAHPTGRLIGQRPGFEFDYEYIFELAAKENVALEINAHPQRLDLNDTLTRLAISKGCKIVLNTDAHSVAELDLIRFGVNIAQRGWVQPKDLFLL